MNTLRLEIPEKYAISFGKNDDEVRRNASEMLAVGMYHQGKWSVEAATKFIGVTCEQFAEILRCHRVEAVEVANPRQS